MARWVSVVKTVRSFRRAFAGTSGRSQQGGEDSSYEGLDGWDATANNAELGFEDAPHKNIAEHEREVIAIHEISQRFDSIASNNAHAFIRQSVLLTHISDRCPAIW